MGSRDQPSTNRSRPSTHKNVSNGPPSIGGLKAIFPKAQAVNGVKICLGNGQVFGLGIG